MGWPAVRARREAARTAGQPITAIQVLAFAAAMGLLGACFGALSEWFQAALRGAMAALPELTAMLARHGALVLGMALVVLVLPAAAWLALGRDR